MATATEAARRDTENRRRQLQKWIDDHFDGATKGARARFIAAHQLNQGEISGLLKDKSFGSNRARHLELQVGMPERYLERRDSNDIIEFPSPGRPVGGLVEIKQYETGGSMGGGVILQDQPGVIQSWRVSEEWVHKNVRSFSAIKNLCVVTGFGDSMRPMFNPGDPLLIDTAVRAIDSDGLYFFRVSGEGFIKRLQRIPGVGIRVLSANRDNYEPWTITEDMDFQVLGRVLKVWCSEDF